MKRLFASGLSCLLFANFSAPVQAQTMRDMFLALPSYCTPGLNATGRSLLVKDTEYTVPARKEEDEIDYSIDTVTDTYLAYEYSNSRGQGTNQNYEIKKFTFTGGKSILMFSKTGDPRVHSNKYILRAFDISGNTLAENHQNLIPEDLDYTVFLKPETPDSIKTSLKKTAYYTFDLYQHSTDKILFHIILESDDAAQWLTGNTIVFTWNGSTFSSSIINIKED